MEKHIQTIKDDLKIISELHEKFPLEKNEDSCGSLCFTFVALSEITDRMKPVVQQYFGLPYKDAGEGAFFKNLFDKFARAVGGMGKDQTIYRKDISNDLTLCCAFWPWGGNPAKTSIRIELLVARSAESDAVAEALKGCFSLS